MSKHDKLLKRFLTKPRDFTYDELRAFLTGLGYDECNIGRTSGSRVAFINSKTGHIIRLHKPHPGNELKRYQIEQTIDALLEQGVI